MTDRRRFSAGAWAVAAAAAAVLCSGAAVGFLLVSVVGQPSGAEAADQTAVNAMMPWLTLVR